jgi:hypothetical protein
MSYYTAQPGGLYGGYYGNAAAFAGPGQLSTDVVRANIPNASLGALIAGGVDLPFGGGGNYKTIQQQFRPGSTDRQRLPDPIRVFPQNEPGREGAINVRFEQAQLMPGMTPAGNAGIDFSPSFQNPVVIPEGFQNQLNQMEKDTRQRPTPLYRFPYPQRYF